MLFRPILDSAHGCASYLVGCPVAGEAVVVDPLAAVGPEEYVLTAADLGLRIVKVIDTHLHADHVSAARPLAEALGLPVALHAAAEVGFPFEPLRDGQEWLLGNVRFRVLHTPGHTPDSLTLVVYDLTRSADDPWLALTGDSLLSGDVARPDLLLGQVDPERVAAQARILYRTLHERLLALPDTVEIYPGHFGGSTCGGQLLSAKPSSTIGFERRHNLALLQPDEDAFVRFVLANLRPQPERYQEIKLQNAGRGAEALRAVSQGV
jgi:hydroxyacylglutathione hydrolase